MLYCLVSELSYIIASLLLRPSPLDPGKDSLLLLLPPDDDDLLSLPPVK
jgi:hypothetical protein